MLLATQPLLQDQILSLLNNWPGQLLSATIAIAFLVMTIISYVKFTFRIRFHERAIESWLD